MPPGSYTEQLPLKPAVFHILLALSRGPLHGLGIADDVADASDRVIQLGPGTLYRSLDEMRSAGLVEKADAPDEGSDPRRKYYRITVEGQALVQAEVSRFQRLVESARDRDVLPEHT